ncbi:MAG: MerR family transcriptional regulator [Parafilimonas sp.]|nr:MerR family transcriptional regulator [Parafilimonas sp.]
MIQFTTLMNHFTIKDIENLSGIKAHTLRIWEKRYGIITPKRKLSKHRFYDGEDLKQILRITHLYNNGYKISAIANMKPDELSSYKTGISSKQESIIKILIEATIDLDEHTLSKTFREAIAAYGLENCIVNIVFPYFEKIGLLWMNDIALPAQERFASNILVKKIIAEIDKLETLFDDEQPATIVFAPLNEHHEVPLLFMHYLLKKSNRNVLYIGVNTDFHILDAYVNLHKHSCLYFHVVTYLLHDDINNYVKLLLQRYPTQKIIMSGKLTSLVSESSGNLHLLHSLDETIAFANGSFKPFN